MKVLLEVRTGEHGAGAAPKLPKPMLQKLSPTDDMEHFLEMFQRFVGQHSWVIEST